MAGPLDFLEPSESPDLPKRGRREELVSRSLDAEKSKEDPDKDKIKVMEIMMANGLSFSEAVDLINQNMLPASSSTKEDIQKQEDRRP